MSQNSGLKDISKHTRVKDMLFGPLERPALQWLCAHSPAWLTPDILTTIGLVGAALSFLGYVLSTIHPAYLLISSFGMLVNWVGDSMDGSLARYRKIERPRYGFFVDHTLDAVAQLIIFLGFAASPYARFDVAMTTLIVYYLMDILVLARTSAHIEARPERAEDLGPMPVFEVPQWQDGETSVYVVTRNDSALYRSVVTLAFDEEMGNVAQSDSIRIVPTLIVTNVVQPLSGSDWYFDSVEVVFRPGGVKAMGALASITTRCRE